MKWVTSHYMLCTVSDSFEKLAQYLDKYFGNVHSKQWATSEGRVAVILGESYFIRADSNAAILMTLKEVSISETSLEIISCAGSSGVWEISWGAHGSYVNRVKDSLQKAGFNVEVTKEIHNYSPSSTDTS
jgi:hypothetical protein